jgi:pSer/pThr/pTyr-binding forkhead associated (FHA) protein/HD-GYP domain-containing protein (c-di-GMP phosphodiesterase class II)
MSKIRIATGPYRGREKTLAEKPLTIGRDAEAGIQILDRSASRFHAEIFPVGGMYFVKDLESKNGTFINDDRLKDEELLREGDVIKIGSTELVYESGSALAEDDDANRIAYQDDAADVLSRTLEFRLDELSDIDEISDEPQQQDNAKGLRILYQLGRMLAEDNDHGEREATVLDYLIQSMPAEAALIFRREAASGKLVPNTVRTSAPHIQPVISRSIIKKTFTENKAIHSANAMEDARFERQHSIIQKNIRSVICVPLAVGGGAPRGVLYLSRGAGATPFDQMDLELTSACAIQLGLAQAAAEQSRRQRATTWQLLSAMINALELRTGVPGAGQRCTRTVVALAKALKLDVASVERLRIAGMMHHLDRLVSDDASMQERAWALFAGIDGLESVLPLARHARERLDGTGPLKQGDDDLDIEPRILAVAVAFEERTANDQASDHDQVIDTLGHDPGFDAKVVRCLQNCHLDGSLYAKVEE